MLGTRLSKLVFDNRKAHIGTSNLMCDDRQVSLYPMVREALITNSNIKGTIMTQRFFGKMKDEGDIAFHFGFEGCSGYRDFYSRMEPYEILYANGDNLAGLEVFYMVLREHDAKTHDSGLFEVVSISFGTSPDDFKIQPITVESLRRDAIPGIPQSYIDFVNHTFPPTPSKQTIYDTLRQMVDSTLNQVSV